MRPGVTVTSMNAWKPLLIGAAFAALTAAPALATPILAHTTYVWTIHGDVPHSVEAGPEGAVIYEIFSPPRESDWAGIAREAPRPPRWPA